MKISSYVFILLSWIFRFALWKQTLLLSDWLVVLFCFNTPNQHPSFSCSVDIGIAQLGECDVAETGWRKD